MIRHDDIKWTKIKTFFLFLKKFFFFDYSSLFYFILSFGQFKKQNPISSCWCASSIPSTRAKHFGEPFGAERGSPSSWRARHASGVCAYLLISSQPESASNQILETVDSKEWSFFQDEDEEIEERREQQLSSFCHRGEEPPRTPSISSEQRLRGEFCGEACLEWFSRES